MGAMKQLTKVNKSLLMVSSVFLISIIVLIPTTFSWYTHYTIQEWENEGGVYGSRCDHVYEDQPDPWDAWTGCGVSAEYYDTPPTDLYWAADYYFQRGIGGEQQYNYTWEVDSPLYCTYIEDSNYYYHNDYDEPEWSTGGSWPAYYHNYQTDIYPLNVGYGAYTVGVIASSYFENTSNPNHHIYISSHVDPEDMYAADPQFREE